jgi:hypothetical protein
MMLSVAPLGNRISQTRAEINSLSEVLNQLETEQLREENFSTYGREVDFTESLSAIQEQILDVTKRREKYSKELSRLCRQEHYREYLVKLGITVTQVDLDALE